MILNNKREHRNINLDKEIEKFIDNMPDGYVFSLDDAKYILGYSGCEAPPFVFNKYIQDEISEHFPSINILTNSESIRALCYGYGSSVVLANTNAVIKSWQEDYYCFRVTQGLHYDKMITGDIEVIFRNMADYFADYKGNNIKYNVVIVFPHKTEYHKKVDTNNRFSDLSSFAYYTLRGTFFLLKGGVLVSLVPKIFGQEILENKDLLPNNNNITVTYEGDYAVIKIILL